MGQRTVLTRSGDRPASPASEAPADTARHWFGGNYLGAAPPASARPELSRGGWGSRSREDEITSGRLVIRAARGNIGPDARSAEVDPRQDR